MKFRPGPLGTPVVIVGAWVVARVASSMSDAVPPATTPIIGIRTPVLVANAPVAPIDRPSSISSNRWRNTRLASKQAIPRLWIAIAQTRPSVALSTVAPVRAPHAKAFSPNLRSGIVGGALPSRQTSNRPLTGSAWALVNGTGGAISVPSLGGSQAGVRLFLQGENAPFALTARISRALGRLRDTEVSAGYAFRARNVGLIVERRERLDARDGAFVATGYGGAYDVHLPAGLRFDGFAQGGVAGLRSRRWFADGQARVTRQTFLSADMNIGAGGGVWASAQQGVRRVEAGPLIESRIRAGVIGLRVAGEYRFRLTGDAQPRSGPALTVGLDF